MKLQKGRASIADDTPACVRHLGGALRPFRHEVGCAPSKWALRMTFCRQQGVEIMNSIVAVRTAASTVTQWPHDVRGKSPKRYSLNKPIALSPTGHRMVRISSTASVVLLPFRGTTRLADMYARACHGVQRRIEKQSMFFEREIDATQSPSLRSPHQARHASPDTRRPLPSPWWRQHRPDGRGETAHLGISEGSVGTNSRGATRQRLLPLLDLKENGSFWPSLLHRHVPPKCGEANVGEGCRQWCSRVLSHPQSGGDGQVTTQLHS